MPLCELDSYLNGRALKLDYFFVITRTHFQHRYLFEPPWDLNRPFHSGFFT